MEKNSKWLIGEGRQTVPAVHLAPSEGLSELAQPWFSHLAHSSPGLKEIEIQLLSINNTNKIFPFILKNWDTCDSRVRSLAFSLSFSSCSLAISCRDIKNSCEGGKTHVGMTFLEVTPRFCFFFTLLRSSDTPPSFNGASLGLLVSWIFFRRKKTHYN